MLLFLERHLWMFLKIICNLSSIGAAERGIFTGHLLNKLFQYRNFTLHICEIAGVLEFLQSLFVCLLWSVEEKQTELNSQSEYYFMKYIHIEVYLAFTKSVESSPKLHINVLVGFFLQIFEEFSLECLFDAL